MEEVSNEKIYLELLKIKSMLKESLDLQREMTDIEEEIKLFEGKQAQNEEKIVSAIKRKKFNSVFDWKGAVWDNCQYRKDHVSEATISFYCDLIKAPCRFESCPRNNLDE